MTGSRAKGERELDDSRSVRSLVAVAWIEEARSATCPGAS